MGKCLYFCASMSNQKVSIKNKRAFFEYQFILNFTAGIQLLGTEIKSLREGKANLTDAYCYLQNGELFVKGMHIAEYSYGSYNNHEPKRPRKLLLNRSELNKLAIKLKEKGLTVIPLHLYLNEKGLAKLEIALSKGKKIYDKREDMKKKDSQREIDRARKSY